MEKRLTFYEARDIFREDQRLFEKKIAELKIKTTIINPNNIKRDGKSFYRPVNHQE